MTIKQETNVSMQSASEQMNEGIDKLNIELPMDIAKDYLCALMSRSSLVSGYYLDLNTGRSVAISQEKVYHERYNGEDDWSRMDDYIRECVHPDDQAAVTAASRIDFIRECLKTKQEYSLDLRDFATGQERWLRYVIMRCSDADHAAIIFRDITKSQQRKIELAKTKDELTKSFGISSALTESFKNIYLIDKQSRTIEVRKLDGYVTQGLEKSKIGPYPYDALVANYIQKRVFKDDKSFVTKALDWDTITEGVKDDKSYQFTYRVLENDELHFYQGLFHKINEQYIVCGFQNVDDTLAREKEYNDIIATAGFGVWHIYLKDGEASRMQANEKMAELLGIDASNMTEEEVYDAWYSRITPAAIPSVQKSVGEMLEGKFSENTYLWTHPTKGDIYVRCGGTAFKQADGSFVVRGYHADVTEIVHDEQKHNKELEEAKDAADAANRAKTTFLFNMSHDIRTPMNAIMGFRDMLEKHQDDPVRRKDYLRKIDDSSKILLSIINNVLEMARIEKGTLKVDDVAWSAEQFNDTLYSVFRDMMEQKGISFTRQIVVQNNFVFCDPIKLREIFINIISNAYKYTNPGGSVNMHLEEIPSNREGWALYQTTISDTGIGMSKEFLPHIYDEFARENNTTDAKVEGTGLGMPIVKRLVEILNGTIEVTSEKGKGSTFIVTIPHRIANREELIDHQNSDVDPKLFEGKRILLTEDNDLNAEIATDTLEEAGLKIERAEDGVICCQMLENAVDGYYDLILMDIQMPNMNGYEATKKIRKMENAAKAYIPIIAMTANAFEEDKREALAAGMNGHLPKPVKARTLIREIANILTSKH